MRVGLLREQFGQRATLGALDLGTVDPDDVGGLDKDWAKDALATERERIVALQERLYAERARSLLLVFHAIDTGTIGVMKGRK